MITAKASFSNGIAEITLTEPNGDKRVLVTSSPKVAGDWLVDQLGVSRAVETSTVWELLGAGVEVMLPGGWHEPAKEEVHDAVSNG